MGSAMRNPSRSNDTTCFFRRLPHGLQNDVGNTKRLNSCLKLNAHVLFIPREARFINLSLGDRARIAKGRSNLDLPIYFSKVSAQLPSNKAKSRPLTVAYSHVSSFLACLSLAANICVFIHRL